MDLKKNDIITVRIEDLGSEGMGIAKVDGYALFIKDSIPGDLCDVRITKVNKNFGFARLERIIEASEDRVEPKCKNAKRCGGCQLMALKYKKQLEFKANKVKNNIERIGGVKDFIMEPIVGMDEPYRYRNKTQYPVGLDKEGSIIYGFYAGRTHDIISTSDCRLAPEINKEIMEEIVSFMEEYHIKPYNEVTYEGLVRHVLIRNAKEGIMVCLIINGNKLPKSDILVRRLKDTSDIDEVSLNVNKSKNNVILGDDVIILSGKGYVIDYIEDLKFKISPKSFYQVNMVQTSKLYSIAREYADVNEGDVVWDMYCGIGTMSLFYAKKAGFVYGVEIVPEAIDDARENARINNIENVKFYVGAAEDVVPAVINSDSKSKCPDVVVVDPPRKGCDKTLLETIATMNPKRLVYVSCDSATLARDIKILTELGFVLKKVRPVDMFPHTVHVETIALIERVRNAKDFVQIGIDAEEYYRIKDEEKTI